MKKVFFVIVLVVNSLLSFSQYQEQGRILAYVALNNNCSGYYADECYPPMRTDTVPALIVYYMDFPVFFNLSHPLLIDDGFVIFDIYLTGGIETVYVNGNIILKPQERREFIGFFLAKEPFSDKIHLYDYTLKTEFE